MFNNIEWNQVRSMAVAALCAVVLAVAATPRAAADEFDKKTIVTFNAPVEIPGKALPAGTYVFKLLDSTANRNIVQIFDKDEKQLYATILAVPDYRMQPSDKPVIQFEERSSGGAGSDQGVVLSWGPVRAAVRVSARSRRGTRQAHQPERAVHAERYGQEHHDSGEVGQGAKCSGHAEDRGYRRQAVGRGGGYHRHYLAEAAEGRRR